MKPSREFDYYIRSITASLLALGILGVTLYLFLVGRGVAQPLLQWAGLIIGVYIGAHVSVNGRRRMSDDDR